MATVRSGERTYESRTDQASADRLLPGQRVSAYRGVGWTALGRHVTLLAADAGRLPDAAASARVLLDKVDRISSPVDPDGDLRRANASAGQWVSVDPLLADVVHAAARVAAATSGIVDPDPGCDLPVLRHAGPPASPRSGQVLPVGAIVQQAWKAIEIDADGGLMIPADTALDLGGLGRAFAADLVARQVSAETGTSLVICIGGDIAVGTLPSEQHRWRISISEHPDDPRRGPAVTVVVTEGAVSTSSMAPRRAQPFGVAPPFAVSAPPLHDPGSGVLAAATWRTASVCAATCVDASAASAAALLLGDQAPAWLWQRSLAARLTTPTGRVLRIAGWPET